MQVLYETDCLTGNFSEKTENVRTKDLCRGRFLFFNHGIAYRKSAELCGPIRVADPVDNR